ncbi:MAG: hypothetical protein IT347_10670 [Candidatus Eisenbacteria bacterium]|nr:hypothetical protein [Candidatus Eisenbacteria bacterium]
MKQIATLFLVLCASALLPAMASAGQKNIGLTRIFGTAHVAASITIPPEWGGIWDVTDSTYDCLGNFQSVDTEPDTLCPGTQVIGDDENPVVWDCSGTADANSVNVTCTGSSELMPDCVANYTYTISGTRSSDSYFVVTTISITYSGTAKGCDMIPPYCSQNNSHGIRTAPTPVSYCQTPVRPGTWGELKVRYR